MIVLDTDTLSLYFNGHRRVFNRVESAAELPVTSIVSRIEVLQGRFASILTAEDAAKLHVAQARLEAAEKELAKFEIVYFDTAAGAVFDRLRHDKKLKIIG